jgi:SAM-dependent methyltransferase
MDSTICIPAISDDWAIVCPNCRVALQSADKSYVCPDCKQNYPVDAGVIRFGPSDPFYEGRYEPLPVHFLPNEHRPWGVALLYLVSMHYFWYIRKYVPSRGRILDLACGGGMRYLGAHYHTAGLEVSFGAAQEMAKHYNLALQADAMRIPLADGAVDAIASRFFLEHVPLANKRSLLAECRRVLKPGGWFITLQDCDCHNPLWIWAKRDKITFDRRFVEDNGHSGLIFASENLELFRLAGFEVIAYQGSNKTPWVSLPMLEWMQPLRNNSRLAGLLVVAPVINRSRWLNAIYTLSMTLWDDFVERLLPLDHARYLLVACRRQH